MKSNLHQAAQDVLGIVQAAIVNAKDRNEFPAIIAGMERREEALRKALEEEIQLAHNSEPTTAELIAAGIEPDVWADPESWDDKEYAFFWRREAERLNRLEADTRAAIANHFQWPACWSELLPRILAMGEECDNLKKSLEAARDAHWRSYRLLARIADRMGANKSEDELLAMPVEEMEGFIFELADAARAECDRMRGQLDLIGKASLEHARDALSAKAECERLKADAARLDWLADNEIIEGFADLQSDIHAIYCQIAVQECKEDLGEKEARLRYRIALRRLLDTARGESNG